MTQLGKYQTKGERKNNIFITLINIIVLQTTENIMLFLIDDLSRDFHPMGEERPGCIYGFVGVVISFDCRNVCQNQCNDSYFIPSFSSTRIR